MLNANVEIMQLIIAYTCVGVFVSTAVAVVLNLFGVIALENSIRKKLQVVLLIEIITICVALFSGLIKLNPTPVVNQVEEVQNQVRPRVFIHITDESQRNPMEELQNRLVNQGFNVPEIENVAGKPGIPKRTNVRFFNDEDASRADTVVLNLKELGFESAYTYRVQMSARIGTIEVWLTTP